MDNYMLIGASVILLISVLVSKIADRFGVPVLLLFLILGMLAGSDGLGGIYFDDPALAQIVGVIALILILFFGGLSTEWNQIRPVLKEGLLLSTLGVFITALIVGLFAGALLGLSLVEGLLLGSIVSSTDAAAVFSVLRSKGISLKGRIKSLLELESGSNDPMAIFLTIGLIQLITQPDLSPLSLIRFFIQQMLVGAALGYVMGRAILFLVNRLKLGYEGLYSVLMLALVFLTFGLTDLIGGSGFLAVYLAGIVLGHHDFIHKRSILRFQDGLAWIMQIAMFLTLGLLVFPSRLVPIIGIGMLIAAFLMFIARPVSVFIGLIPSALTWREKTFISWVGLRGAAPIILATFPFLAKLQQADLIFNVVFFVVLNSVLLQGTSIPIVAKWLGVDAPMTRRRTYPIEYTPVGGFKSELKELLIPPNSTMAGKAIVELELPEHFLVVLIARENDFMLPSGGTALQEGDTLLALSDRESFDEVAARFGLSESHAAG
ncbi:MAG: potassium/proton antiporter [Anaerolineae bacterium CFX3]|nr:potassium/proton antiporter [Anaerolineales bacterium]MCE7906258.1 potassium/proton antiporter [Anaerolineae bacterium CFX3]MCQ3947482.1 potassium/proton antiporter [Anaerolineae bacterium]RIK25790.1 MAG: potassium/proton antiporter [Anaerolineae bacterium]HPP61737.1 potassium/proton antiporter [Anaerolineales bacterium]